MSFRPEGEISTWVFQISQSMFCISFRNDGIGQCCHFEQRQKSKLLSPSFKNQKPQQHCYGLIIILILFTLPPLVTFYLVLFTILLYCFTHIGKFISSLFVALMVSCKVGALGKKSSGFLNSFLVLT